MIKTPKQMAEEAVEKTGYHLKRSVVDGTIMLRQGMDRQLKRQAFLNGFLDGYQAAKDELADADKVMLQWISVKDRLPENSVGWTTVYGCILSRWAVQPGFYTKYSGVWVSRFVDQDEDYHNYLPFESVTHWMPLPEAPKGEG